MIEDKKNIIGSLIVLIGPSGCGKGTVLKELISKNDNIFLSVSATTRKPRVGEIDKVDYYFMEKVAFEKLLANDGFMEFASYCDNYYGTPKEAVLTRLNKGENIILEIEMQGAKQVKKMYPNAVMLFIAPPSMEKLEMRLRGRGTETDEVIEKRMAVARKEIVFANDCDYIVINDNIDDAVNEIMTIINANSHSVYIMQDFIKSLQK